MVKQPAPSRGALPKNADTPLVRRLLGRALAPTSAASMLAFRAGLGAILLVSTLRFMHKGWVERFFLERTFFFKYWLFDFVEPLPYEGMYAVLVCLAALSACLILGIGGRLAVGALWLLFTYVELVDVTNYLNHYYLVSLLLFLLLWQPLPSLLSKAALRSACVPAWWLWLFRFQFACVYFYAGIAKLGADWLLNAEPLRLWLRTQQDLPWFGPWFGELWVAYAFSWAGCVYDLSIAGWLLWRRSRPWAFAALVGFHLAVGLLFTIGVFPFVMVLGGTLFFCPNWPINLWRVTRGKAGVGPTTKAGDALSGSMEASSPAEAEELHLVGAHAAPLWGHAAVVLYVGFQLLFPLRSVLYPGNVLWHEQGMRWAWKVLVREKSGSVTYWVTQPDGSRKYHHPRSYVTGYQEQEMAGQPDLILQLAHHIGRLHTTEAGVPEVRARAVVSLNGRRPAPLIDPERNLMQISDSLAVADWVLPAPEGAR